MTALQTDERTDDAVPSAAVIGGGPAGLMAAEVMAKAGIKVEIFDTMPSVGRKFLLAGGTRRAEPDAFGTAGTVRHPLC